MASNEPINLTEWKPRLPARQGGRLFTCGRPGRATFGTDRSPVHENTIDRWAMGLPEAEVVHIVSLLGHKKGGFSEFGYYPFRSSKECEEKPTFQEWLDQRYSRRFVVHEFPTRDREGLPRAVLNAVRHCVLDLIENDNTVVVVDSAGAERTARVCEAIGYERMVQRLGDAT